MLGDAWYYSSTSQMPEQKPPRSASLWICFLVIFSRLLFSEIQKMALPSFSHKKLLSSYAVLDFLLHLTQNSRASASWWSIPFTCLFLSAIWEVLQVFSSDQVNTNSEQLRSQMNNFTAVSSGNILGSVLFKCPLLSNCGNLWTLFHQLPASVHSRGVSIYIAVWWWQWPDRPKRLPPLRKAISLQRCQKTQ